MDPCTFDNSTSVQLAIVFVSYVLSTSQEMCSTENAPAAGSSNVDSGAIVKVTYQFVAFDTGIKNAFPSEDVNVSR